MIDERNYPWPPGTIERVQDRAAVRFGIELPEETALAICKLVYAGATTVDNCLIVLASCGPEEIRRMMTVERLAAWERAYSKTYGAAQQRLGVAMRDLMDAVMAEARRDVGRAWGWRRWMRRWIMRVLIPRGDQ